MKQHIFSLALMAILALAACQSAKDNIEPPQEEEPANSLSAKINGEEFSVSGILVTAQYSASSQMIESLAIGGAEPPLNGTATAIALAIVSIDGTGINPGETYTANSSTKAGAGEYVFENSNTDIKAESDNTDEVTITITAIDFDRKVVSGTFSFDGVDEDDPGTVYEVREGVFKEVSFD